MSKFDPNGPWGFVFTAIFLLLAFAALPGIVTIGEPRDQETEANKRVQAEMEVTDE